MPPIDSTSASTPAVPAAPAAAGKFVRLPGRATTLRLRAQGGVTLYLADTCLLQVQVLRLRESYLRFAYKDIQAIEICRTARGVAYSATLAVVTVLFLLGALAAGEAEARYGLIGGAGFFAVFLAVELVRGATCRCIVQTATGKHHLPSLVRLKPARRALELIATRIAAVQGTLDQPTAAQRMEEFLLNHSSRHIQRAAAAQAPATAPVPAAAETPVAAPTPAAAAATPAPGQPAAY